MPVHTTLTQRLGLSNPIVQAPMAGGADTADLVAAVGEAGGIGFVGAAYLSPEQIAERARAIRARTSRPFGINLFAPLPAPEAPDAGRMDAAVAAIARHHVDLGLPAPGTPALGADGFAAQLAAALDCGASAFSFTFGIPPADALAAIKARGMLLIGTATGVEEAVALERAGMDAVIAQGAEAGGHRGSFATGPGEVDFAAGLVGTMALVPQVADAVELPVLASGGIMDGRGIAAALALGAAGVQMGTAFLTCAEAGIPEAHKQAILDARETQTRVTRAFSGRPARGIVNRVMEDIADGAALPFPLQNVLTRPMRTAAAQQGRAEFLSLWAGQGVRLARRQTAAELMTRLVDETDAAVRRLTGIT
ncbi:nitronate monooxygenase [Azospirillum brasilense]|uniref:Nitronate monooxygenase n=1 Tax=Azospirillum brasilense TaxID=192 RepID=A0A0P0ECV7_AZOBR|nr:MULTISPECIES: nitronate monooxygenase [Azospirillum]ALJ35506.1 nitronate monooxygenase [Azospirillum brasilense]MDW7555634.1 nitronate monooxygenase [Azospirillum brasilense]MDW7595561.1 nitronate monooxygenase [Azospirillum brasilense]MDW7630566.1 nitronate monooxygenase [Azospirillum brasilense]MDX5954238.1 nitronate monooxygenase [Azospirillum brasilense]